MCFKKSKIPKWSIYILSLITLICGVVMAILAYMLTDSDLLKKLEEDKELNKIKDVRNLAFIILLIFAIFTVVIAILGYCVRCCKNKCFFCVYGLLLLPSFLIVLGFGAACYAFATLGEDVIEDACKDLQKELNQSFDISADGYTVTISFDIYQSVGVNRWMCSPNCPCTGDHAAKWASKPGVQTIYKRDISQDPWVFGAATGYTTYQACIEDKNRVAVPTTEGVIFDNFAKGFRDQSDYKTISDWIAFFEKEYSCAGICAPSLFAWSTDISKGPPSKSCILGIKDDVGSDFKNLGIAAILAGLGLFFTFICQYCLWGVKK